MTEETKLTEESSKPKLRWYVVQAFSGYEARVQKTLIEHIEIHGLQDKFGQILVPTEEVVEMRAGQKRRSERKFFPGYVLIEANLIGEIPHVIKNVQNVIGFLGAEKGGDPVPLRQTEVNRILGKVDELSEMEEEFAVPYVVGEEIKVIDGPFNNFSGIIEEVNEEKKKLKVMVKIFGRKTPLELGYMQVEKIS